jgi:hypothetical protein
MMRRLVVLISATALVVLATAPAVADDLAFEMTVNPTATLNQFNTELTVSGSYTCSGDFDPEHSGLSGEAFQSQKGDRIVVGGGFGIDPIDLICNTIEQPWEFVIQAQAGEESATWNRGRVIFNAGGGIGDGTEEHQAGDGFLGSVKITH